MLSMEELFKEWAGIVRECGEVPSIAEYQLRSQHSCGPLRNRFRSCPHVPGGLLQYAEKNGLGEQWADVLEITRRHGLRAAAGGASPGPWKGWDSGPKILNDRPVYGEPFLRSALGFAPVNEMGVVFLFGAMAEKLGFIVTWIGTQYPDVEAFREVAPGRWQRVRIRSWIHELQFSIAFPRSERVRFDCVLGEQLVGLSGGGDCAERAIANLFAADFRRCALTKKQKEFYRKGRRGRRGA